jgi:hypothetical protein
MTSPAVGRSLELYYIDGRPDGMLTAQMFNWTGHVLMVPRLQLADALARPEAAYTGVYLLLGEQEGEPRAYIGEGEDIAARIKSHDVHKDWWSTAVLIVTAANKLNKAHARYLEARLIQEARRIGHTPLDNGTTPTTPGLSEADVANREAFLENLFTVLPAVRVDTFVRKVRPTPIAMPAPPTAAMAPLPAPGRSRESPRFMIMNRKKNVKATAYVEDGEFIVERGSTASSSWSTMDANPGGYGRLHAELRRSGVLIPDGNVCRFAQSYAFKSPSAAGSIVNGSSTNGQKEWRTEDGQSYKAWEASQLAG